MLRLTYVPILWKFSIIIMILKPGKPPDSPESYRPICLLPLFSKLFEKLILKHIMPIIGSKLPHHQFGFQNKHSTIQRVHRLVDKISYSLEKKNKYALLHSLTWPKPLIESGTLVFYLKLILFSPHTIIWFSSHICKKGTFQSNQVKNYQTLPQYVPEFLKAQ